MFRHIGLARLKALHDLIYSQFARLKKLENTKSKRLAEQSEMPSHQFHHLVATRQVRVGHLDDIAIRSYERQGILTRALYAIRVKVETSVPERLSFFVVRFDARG